MGWLQAILLGMVQGLTEFLPVSSSGHLVLLQSLFGLEEPELFFDISVHIGTLVAVCVFFFADLRDIASAMLSKSTWTTGNAGLLHQWRQVPEMRLLGLIFVGSLPTAVLGLAFRPLATILFSSVPVVGMMLLVTGFLLWCTRPIKKKGRTEPTVWDALTIGVMQGLAILPGISRSGSTIAIGLFKGLDREMAARYSFLLSIPAIVGAMTLEFIQARMTGLPPLGPSMVGACVAGTVGYAALKTLVGFVKKGNLYLFAFYCWPLGATIIVCSL
jgi:undecaprenyl-diphosphatase